MPSIRNLVKAEEGQFPSVISAYAYGLSLFALAVGSIWFTKFWSNMYDRIFPVQPK